MIRGLTSPAPSRKNHLKGKRPFRQKFSSPAARLKRKVGSLRSPNGTPPSTSTPVTSQEAVDSPGGDAFGATIVSGGDADLDTAATHVADTVGRVIIDDRSHPAYVGADAHNELQAHLVGTAAGLEALAARGDTAPLLLRLSDPAAAECVAGVWEPAAASRLRSHTHTLQMRSHLPSRSSVNV